MPSARFDLAERGLEIAVVQPTENDAKNGLRRVATLEPFMRQYVTRLLNSRKPWAEAHGYTQWPLRGQPIARVGRHNSGHVMLKI